jgi:glutathione S-transferase
MQPTDHPIVFGAPYSVYVRAARLALEEKGVPYELVPVDIFASGGPSPEHKARHRWPASSASASVVRANAPP